MVKRLTPLGKIVNKLSKGVDQRVSDLEEAVVDVYTQLVATPKSEDGKKGERGLAGANGRDGKNGSNGRAGIDGFNGINGINGRNGEDGREGEKGDEGEKGEKGEDGKTIIRETHSHGGGGSAQNVKVQIERQLLAFTLVDGSRAFTGTVGGITPVVGSDLTTKDYVDSTTGQTTSGTADRITVTDGSGDPVIDIASTYVGQTSITTLGTIATGTWDAGTVTATGDSAITATHDGNQQLSRVLAEHTLNTGGSSNARLQAKTGGDSGGDPSLLLSVGLSTNFSIGIDNSDDDSVKEQFSITIGDTPTRVITTAGEQTMPLQPAFLAHNSVTDTNVTGDGTVYTVIFDTEIYDQNSDYNPSTGVFTAPVAGIYHLIGRVVATDFGASHDTGTVEILTSNRRYQGNFGGGVARASASGAFGYGCSCDADMDAGDTAVVNLTVFSSTKTIDVQGTGSTVINTYFSGRLVC